MPSTVMNIACQPVNRSTPRTKMACITGRVMPSGHMSCSHFACAPVGCSGDPCCFRPWYLSFPLDLLKNGESPSYSTTRTSWEMSGVAKCTEGKSSIPLAANFLSPCR
jgi:hypothetical protein